MSFAHASHRRDSLALRRIEACEAEATGKIKAANGAFDRTRIFSSRVLIGDLVSGQAFKI